MTRQTSGISDHDYWLDRPRNISIIVWALTSICVLLFFSDAFYHKHVFFEIENMFGFYGVFGFTVYVALVLTAKWLRTFLMRPEDFYDRDV
jgi:hypothetical protein